MPSSAQRRRLTLNVHVSACCLAISVDSGVVSMERAVPRVAKEGRREASGMRRGPRSSDERRDTRQPSESRARPFEVNLKSSDREVQELTSLALSKATASKEGSGADATAKHGVRAWTPRDPPDAVPSRSSATPRCADRGDLADPPRHQREPSRGPGGELVVGCGQKVACRDPGPEPARRRRAAAGAAGCGDEGDRR